MTTEHVTHDQRAYETPSFQLGPALRRRWPLVLLLGVVCAVLGAAVGLAANPTYTSTAQFLVGSPNVIAQAVPGYVAATQSLASSYSRQAESSQLVVPVARQMGLSPATVSARLSASPVPDSNIINLAASGPSANAAHQLAVVASKQLQKLVHTTEFGSNGSGTLKAYEQESNAIELDEALIRQISAAQSSSTTATQSSSTTAAQSSTTVSPAMLAAQTALAAAQLRAQALAANFVQSQQTSSAAAGVQTLNAAGSATNNRSSVAQKAILAGLVAGLVLGGLVGFLLETSSIRSKTRPAG